MFLFLTTVAADDCESGWSKHVINNKVTCAKRITEPNIDRYHITVSAKKCAEFGAKLPLPKNELENEQIYAVVKGLGSTGNVIDATYEDGKWVDSDGNPLSWTGWESGYPSDRTPNQLWIHFSGYKGEQWRSSNGQTNIALVCFKDPHVCEDGWSEHVIVGRVRCIKQIVEGNVKKFKMLNAASKCAEYGAKLPLPKSQQENDEMFNLFKDEFDVLYGHWSDSNYKNVPIHFIPIDVTMNDEGEWTQSNGNSLSWTRWVNEIPYADVRQQFILLTDYKMVYNDNKPYWEDTDTTKEVHIICIKDIPEPVARINRCNNEEGEMVLDVTVSNVDSTDFDGWDSSSDGAVNKVFFCR